MIGENQITFNAGTMDKIVEYYLKTVLFTGTKNNVEVTNVTQTNGNFNVKFKMVEVPK